MYKDQQPHTPTTTKTLTEDAPTEVSMVTNVFITASVGINSTPCPQLMRV